MALGAVRQFSVAGLRVESYLSALNEAQRQAVCHYGSPLLILAGAGSGKTRVITTKIAHLIRSRQVRPEQILAVTFTNKAAREMRTRACALESAAQGATICTFHALGVWILRRYAVRLGLNPHFSIYDDHDVRALLPKILPHCDHSRAGMLARGISQAKNYGLDCASFESVHARVSAPACAARAVLGDRQFAHAYACYHRRMREMGTVDFGDLIMLPVQLLREHQDVAEQLHARWQVVMVDEYQDSNVAQFHFLQVLTGAHTYLCVVGDDDQSIYRFRGAEVKNILTFPEFFQNTQIIRLEYNYRSTDAILRVADSVVKKNQDRLGKALIAQRTGGTKPRLFLLNNQDEEAALCVHLIQEARARGIPYADWAILYRVNAQSLSFEQCFLRNRIPYRIVGTLKFYSRAEVKDVLAFLQLIVNGSDELALRRVLNKPPRGIGEKTQDALFVCAQQAAITDFTTLQSTHLTALGTRARQKVSSFLSLLRALRARMPQAPAAGEEARTSAPPEEPVEERTHDAEGLARFVSVVMEHTGLEEWYRQKDEEEGTQCAVNVQELMNAASLYACSHEGLVSFLEHIQLDQNMADEGGAADAVHLITIHNTKGLEFRRVILTGLENGVFPRDDEADIQEERRLMYVACTRAMDSLYLTACAYRRMWGRHTAMKPSRFLTELDSALLEITDPRHFA